MSISINLSARAMDEAGRLDSPLHRLDPRTKLLATAAFIVAVMSFPRLEIAALTPFFAYPIVLLASGRLPARMIVVRLLVASPFALLVGICNPLLDRQPGMLLGTWTITTGWLSFASIMLRFMLTASAALILVASTGIHRLCAGLERLGTPRPLVVQIHLLYRYLFVLADEGRRMRRAAQLRTGGNRGLSFHVYVALLGNLLVRAVDRAQRIHQAMLARGFDRHLHGNGLGRLTRHDAAFLLGWCALFLLLRCWNIAHWLGAWLA